MVDPAEDLAALAGAEGPDDLWRWLVSGPAGRSDPNSWLAEMVFHHLHADDPADAWRTAGLLCTDSRWRAATGPLVRAIERSGFVAEDELDQLAGEFVFEDEYAWPVPNGWLHDGTVRVEPPLSPGAPPPRVVVERPIQPPLRRWGTDRLVRRGRCPLGDLLAVVPALPARAGDHVMLGLLDALDVLTPDDARALVELCATWTSGTVRLGALERVARRDGPDVAVRLAASDPNAKVRKWGDGLARRAAARPRREGGGRSAGPDSRSDESPGASAQASLFDV